MSSFHGCSSITLQAFNGIQLIQVYLKAGVSSQFVLEENLCGIKLQRIFMNWMSYQSSRPKLSTQQVRRRPLVALIICCLSVCLSVQHCAERVL